MANKSNLYFKDDLKDEEPYSSVSDRDPLEQVGVDKLLDADDDGDNIEATLPMGAPLAAPALSQSDAVKAAISQKLSSSKDGYLSDPLMSNFKQDQQNINDLRQAKRGADFIGNMGQAFSQLAQGSNTPKPNQALYENLGSQNQEMMKGAEGDLERKQKVIQAIEQRKSREGVAANNLALHEMMMKQHSLDAGSRAQDKANDKQNTTYNNTVQLLESARNNPAVAQAEKDIYAADKAKSLANLYGNPDKLSMTQVRMLASEVSKIASGGVPSQHELEGITPGALSGKLSEVYGNLVNDPTPANAGAFIKQYQDYANALTKDAQGLIKDRYGRIISAKKDQLSESQFGHLNDQYLNRFGEISKSGMTAQTEKAGIQTKVVNGVTYEKVPGGWQEVQ